MVCLTDEYGRRMGRFLTLKAARLELERTSPGCKLVDRVDRDGRPQIIVKAPEPTFAALVYARTYWVEVQ